jgi:hypothetical protein
LASVLVWPLASALALRLAWALVYLLVLVLVWQWAWELVSRLVLVSASQWAWELALPLQQVWALLPAPAQREYLELPDLLLALPLLLRSALLALASRLRGYFAQSGLLSFAVPLLTGCSQEEAT